MRDFKLVFDRTFSKSIVKKLLWLVGFILLSIIILYFLGYIPSFYEYGKDPKSHGMFYDVMAMFIDQRNRCSNMSTLFSTIVDVVGLTIVNGLFIAVMTSILSRRVDMYEKGLIHYKMRGHFIIVGYNKLTLLLMKHLYHTNPKAQILLLTSQDVQKLRKKLAAVLSKDEEEQLVIYSGDMTKKEDIAALQAERSLTVYILGETGQDVDSVKMDCVRLLANDLNSKHATKQIRCYVCFDDPDIYHTFLYADIAPEVKKSIHFFLLQIGDEGSWCLLYGDVPYFPAPFDMLWTVCSKKLGQGDKCRESEVPCLHRAVAAALQTIKHLQYCL